MKLVILRMNNGHLKRSGVFYLKYIHLEADANNFALTFGALG